MRITEEYRAELLAETVPITQQTINGVWSIVPKQSDSLGKLHEHLRSGKTLSSTILHITSTNQVTNRVTLTDRILNIKAVSHRFKVITEEYLIGADYEQISQNGFEGKGTKTTNFNKDKTALITKTTSARGNGTLTRRIVGGGKFLLLDYDWTNKAGKRLVLCRLFVRKSSSPLNTSSERNIEAEMKSDCVMLVVGGSGFLGQHLVDHILTKDWEANVRIFDIRPPQNEIVHPRVEFFQGNICKVEDLVKACKDVHTIFHTASPPEGRGRELYEMVNVQGTKNVIEAAKIAKVEQIVFTSTASVVFDGHHIVNGDETLPYVTKFLDPYIETKIIAEKAILAANSPELRTCAVRPSGIFGPRDAQAWPGIIEAGKKGQSKYQLGNGKNLMDWTYVENVAHAHCIAAEKIALTDSPAAGEAFFITNNEPLPFWEMPKYVWSSLGYQTPRIVIPAFLILILAWITDVFVKILSPVATIKPSLTYFRVVLATTSRSFSSEKAKRILGYEPIFSLAEGMAKSLEYFKDQEKKE